MACDLSVSTAVYAGSFDPPTKGHLWMIEQGARLFNKLIIAIGENPNKSYTFSPEQRIKMLESCLPKNSTLEIRHIKHQYLVDYAEEISADYILRGIRSPDDYEYERIMRQVNADISPSVTSIFLMPPREIAEVSSNMVKNLIGPKGWETTILRYVPKPIFQYLVEHASLAKS